MGPDMRKVFISAFLAIFLVGCAQVETKRAAFPSMYSDQKPMTIVIVPAINESTAAEAGDLLNVTVAQPFANHGFYVMPVPIVADIFRTEGILEGSQLKGMPASVFRENFGADAVLFLTIEGWDTNYAVIAANVSVAIEYVLISTFTNEVLWSYEERVVVDTSSSTGNLIADAIATAISTAVTDYVPIARGVHEAAVKAMPYGNYHPKSGTDGEEEAVKTKLKTGALEDFDAGLSGDASTAAIGESASSSDRQESDVSSVVEEEISRSNTPGQAEMDKSTASANLTRIQAVGEAMMCSDSFEMKSRSGNKETWILHCGDNETLKAICVGGECYLQ